MKEVISIRPTEEIEEKLELLSKLEHTERSSLVRKLLLRGAEEELKREALELFREKKVTISRAAEIAGVSIYEMFDLVKQSGAHLNISQEDVLEDIRVALKKTKHF